MLNNPFMYTDPSGEFWHLIVGGIIGGIQGYMIGKAHGAKGWAMFGYILGGAAIGGVAGYTGFSVFSSAMAAGTAAGMGGISAGFNAGLLSGMASGAITGGGMAALRGGSFSDVLAGATMGAWSGAVAGGISGAIAGEMHNIKDGLNFWGNQNSRNTSNLLASLDSPGNIYLGPNNGRLQGVSVYATDLRAAVAAREGMNAAGRFIFQAAMYGSMAASTVGISSAVGGALWRMGARQVFNKGTSRYLYHYTNKTAAQNISKVGMQTKYSNDGFLYLTNKGNLSPLQAQIELALPANRALPSSLLRIDTRGLSPSIIRRVQGNLPRMGAGGGTEFLFNRNIPASAIKIFW